MIQTRPKATPNDTAKAADDHRPDIRSLTFALAGTFVLRCASYGAGSIIPIFLGLRSRTDAEVTAGMAAFIAVTFYAAELLAAPIFGALSDRYGRKFFMLLGPIFGGVAIQMLGFSSMIPVLAAVRILEGFSTASSAPATLGYLSAQTARSERLRGRVMGFYEAATVVGIALGAALAGQLYDHFGTLAFSLVALIYLLALILFMFVRSSSDTRPVAGERHGSFVRRILNRRVMRFAPAWLAANAVLGAWFALGPFLAAGSPNEDQLLMGGFRAGQIGIAQLVFGVLFTAGAIVWGYVMPLIGRQATLIVGVIGLGFTSVSLWLLNNATDSGNVVVGLLVVAVMVGIFVESGFTPAALAYLAEIAEEQAQDRGSVMGLYSVLLSSGQLLGGALAAPFATRLGFNGLIILTGLLCLVALFTVMLLGHAERRERRRRPAASSSSSSA